MPLYEVNVITKALSKNDLSVALKRAATVLLDNGAVIKDMKSLGYKDLPFKRFAKQTGDPVFSSNFFLFHSYMPIETAVRTRDVLRNDLDLVHVSVINTREQPSGDIDCDLAEILKSPAERASVKDLRDGQKIGHFTRQMIYKRIEKEYKAIPKSYPIAPPRN
uniref:28S ribosomal protein S6, mitochondrial n=1 Tax=Panagrellus redivivus TaxID=6233 RepID=A0A7E4VPS7_PANRE